MSWVQLGVRPRAQHCQALAAFPARVKGVNSPSLPLLRARLYSRRRREQRSLPSRSRPNTSVLKVWPMEPRGGPKMLSGAPGSPNRCHSCTQMCLPRLC